MAQDEIAVPPDQLLEHAGYVRRLASFLVRGESDADDLAQDALTATLSHPVRERRALRSFLRRVVRNLAWRQHRGSARRTHREQAVGRAGTAEPADEIVARRELLARISRSVEALPEPYRTAVHLRYYEGRAPARIAADLEVPAATVKTRLRRALHMLRESLDGAHDGRRKTWTALLMPLLPGPATVSAAKGLPAAAYVLAGLLIALPVLGAVWALSQPSAMPPGDGSGVAVLAAPSTPPPTEVRTVPEREEIAQNRTCTVEGRVLDPADRPVPGVRLRLSIRKKIVGKAGGMYDRVERRTTDVEGRYCLKLEGPREVLVSCYDTRWQTVGEPVSVTAPARNADLRVKPVPTGKLVIRVRDLRDNTLVQSFTCQFTVPTPESGWPGEGTGDWRGGVWGDETKDGILVQHIPTRTEPKPTRVQVALLLPVRARKRLTIREGQVVDVEFTIRSGEEVRGLVVDGHGKPVAEALVFPGGHYRGRRGGLMKEFRASRIRDGVRTAADGSFSLRLVGSRLSVWHPRFTATTVERAAARRVVLRPRSGIDGRLVDGTGRAWSGAEVILDQKRSARTDGNGRFSFDGVEAGTRGLHVPRPGSRGMDGAAGGPWTVEVPADSRAEIEIGPGLSEVTIDVRSGGEPVELSCPAFLVGSGPLSSFGFGRIEKGNLHLRNLLPGDYLLVTDRGHLVPCGVRGPHGVVDLGRAVLTVVAPPERRLRLLPVGASPFLRSVMHRVQRKARVPASGRLRFGPLPVGHYEVQKYRAEAGVRVHVVDANTTIKLD